MNQTNNRTGDAMPPSHWKQIREEVLGPMKRNEKQVPEKPRIQSGELQIIENQNANYEDSVRILKEKGLRPITYQEASTTYKEVLIKMARKRGEGFGFFEFYLDGQGLYEHGPCILNEKGELKKGGGAIDDTVSACPGKLPLILSVRPDNRASESGYLFWLSTYGYPYYATVVVGVRDDSVRE